MSVTFRVAIPSTSMFCRPPSLPAATVMVSASFRCTLEREGGRVGEKGGREEGREGSVREAEKIEKSEEEGRWREREGRWNSEDERGEAAG